MRGFLSIGSLTGSGAWRADDGSREGKVTNENFPVDLAARIDEIRKAMTLLRQDMRDRYNRHVSLPDLIFDRWDTARFYGFGENTSCYNNVLILGDVQVGSNCWIGPNVVLDGSGGLTIGNNCSISAGAQIYSHHTVRRSTTLGKGPVDRQSTKIGNGVYIGPGSVVQMGCTIGDSSVIGALSMVNIDVPGGHRCYGVPGKIYPGKPGDEQEVDDV